MAVQVRTAIQKDIPALDALFHQVDRHHSNGLPDYFKPTQRPVRSPDYLLGLINDQNVGLFVAELEHELAGFVQVEMRSAPAFAVFVQRLFAVVDNIGIRRDLRRQGIGSELMQAAESWAKDRGAQTIELNVYAFNRSAIDFYKALGYEPLSHRFTKNITAKDESQVSDP